MSTLTTETLTTLTTRQLIEFTRTSTMTPHDARGWVRLRLAEWAVPAEAAYRAGTVTSELVTNACVYGPMDGVVTVSVRLVSAGIEIAVHDQGRIPPEQWNATVTDEHGRGLAVVKGLSLLFDVEMHRHGGKTITAVVV